MDRLSSKRGLLSSWVHAPYPKRLLPLVIATALVGCGEEEKPKPVESHTQQETQVTPVDPAQEASSTSESPSEQAPPAKETKETAVEATQDSQATQEPTEAQASEAEANTKADEIYATLPFEVTHIGEVSYDGGNTVGIRFSTPVNGEIDFRKYIESTSGTEWVLSEDGFFIYLNNPTPEQAYKVTVLKGLTSAFDKPLEKSFGNTVTLSPAAAQMRFSSEGHYLIRGLHTGLPVSVMNVPEVNATFYKVNNDEEAFLQLLRWKERGTTQYYYSLDEIQSFAKLAYEGRFELTNDKNKQREVNLPVQDIDALNQNGAYIVVMTRPGMYENPVAVSWYAMTDFGVHARKHGKSLSVFVNRLEDGQPVSDVELDLLINSETGLASKTTDSQGFARFDTLSSGRHKARILLAKKDESLTLTPLQTGALDLSDFDIGDTENEQSQLFLYGPRDLYRGGETAIISGILRDQDGKPLGNTPLQAELHQPDGQRVTTFTWRTQANGYYEYQYPIAKAAQTGEWRLTVNLPNSRPEVYTFKVEDFMPERMKLTWNPDQRPDVHVDEAKIRIPVQGDYLYGAPAVGNRFDVDYKIRPEPHPIKAWPKFFFGNGQSDEFNSDWSQDQLAFNQEGRLTLEVENRWSKADIPLRLQMTGQLFESGGRPVVRSYSESILPTKQLVGIRPLFNDSADENSLARFELINTDIDGNLLVANQLQVKLINETKRYHWRYSSSQGWYYESAKDNIAELNLATSIEAGKKQVVELPVKWGSYRVEVTNPVDGLTTTYHFDAGQNWYWDYSQSSDQAARPDQVNLALDKAAYKAGEEATLKITPPGEGETLILVESSDQILWKQSIHTGEDGASVNIPISDEWNRHDIYVTALHLQDAGDQKRITPARSVGILHLPLDRQERTLDVEISAPEKWLPNRTVMAEVKVTSSDGKPVEKASVTLAAVDVGVLSITRFESPEPAPFFFGQKRFSVDMFDMYGQLIELNENKSAKIKFGGDGELSRGGDLAQSEVQILSLFSGEVAVENGIAKIPLELPEFNGKIRLMAVAFDQDHFGSQEKEVTVAAPVVTQLSMPRFVANGDQSSVALDITNLTDQPVTLDAHFSALGPVKLDELDQQIALKENEKQTLLIPFNAADLTGQITFKADIAGAPDYPIDREWKLNVRQAYPATTERLSAALDPQQSLNLPADAVAAFSPATLKANVSISNTVNLNLHEQLSHLLTYPYGCLEQSISSSYPWLYVSDQEITALGLSSVSAEDRSSAIQSGLERIAKRQKGNGSFGLWSADGSEEHWLTAYAGHFMTDAIQKGVNVDQEVLERTLSRLSDYTRSPDNYAERWVEDPEAYEFGYQSYAAYVLARHSRASLSDIRRISRSIPAKASPLAITQLALAAKLMGDQTLFNELSTKANEASRDDHIYIGDYGSKVRDLAQGIHLQIQANIKPSSLLSQYKVLGDEMRKHRYLSTQEQVALFQAAMDQSLLETHPWEANLITGEITQRLKGQSPVQSSLNGSAVAQGVSVVNQGKEALYADIVYQGYPEQAPEAESHNGVSVERRYYDLDGQPMPIKDGIMSMSTGDLVLVELTVSSETYRPDLLLVDLIPAGLELENQNLADSASLSEIRLNKRPLSTWMRDRDVRHEEYRDDRYVAALATGNEYGYSRSTRLYYLARAVTPGEYRVPNALLEDMYQPEARALSDTLTQLRVVQP
jgi:uncharacterized protein YfaS (alpha-2-macroglobulin family)